MLHPTMAPKAYISHPWGRPLACAYLIFLAFRPAVAGGQNTTSPLAEPAETVSTTSGIDCQNLAPRDTSMGLIAKLCEFALSYQRQLPDFIAQQTTTFHGAKSKTILTAQVTYRKGQESYSLLTLDGEPITPNTSIPPDVRFTSAGEFGSLLVSLFKVHGAIEFKFREASTLRNVPAAVYTFHLDQPKNTFWTLRDAAGVDWKPEFRGELWLEKATGRPLREVLEPVHLPSQCLVKSAKTVTDYAMTPVAEIGTFLLPIKSESTVCGRGTWTNPSGCSTNILVFHDYQKFGTTSRILPSDAQP